jgi:hypothetical protein
MSNHLQYIIDYKILEFINTKIMTTASSHLSKELK